MVARPGPNVLTCPLFNNFTFFNIYPIIQEKINYYCLNLPIIRGQNLILPHYSRESHLLFLYRSCYLAVQVLHVRVLLLP